MAVIIKRWIGSNGEILLPLTQETYNEGKMISTKGTYFFPVTVSDATPLQGNPMGLLLTLTYASNV